MTTTPAFRVTTVEPEHAPGLERLFATNGYGCFCRFWHFGGNSKEWLARCFEHPEENAAEMRAAVTTRSVEMQGVIAETSSELVGWLKVAPSETASKLYEQRLYKGLPIFRGDRAGTFAIACLFVREDFRRRGVARALLAAAVRAAPGWGATRLEAFPRSDTDVPGSALMTGPTQLFLEAGFEIVHDFVPYPVLRLELARP